MKNNSIIYQIFLRTATKEGTIKAAKKLLGHIANLGVDIVYLCPICEADDDPREELWSPRQRESGLGNPKNPYRIKDYFKIDEEYGADDDLKSFVKTAHRLGLKVILDLVYYHCGPNAVFIENNPDFIKRLPDGSPDCGEWNFPKLNYECAELCEYMWSNMEYFVREFDVDGYRCDVGDQVPLAFWREGRNRIERIKSDIIMINEGVKDEAISSGVFDANYYLWGFERGMGRLDEVIGGMTMPTKRIIAFENHDTSSDAYDNRMEKQYGKNVCDAMLAVIFTMGNVPFIYNGNEIADSGRHSLWNNRFYGKNLCIDWSEAVTESGRERVSLIKKLAEIYHNFPAVNSGTIEIICYADDLIAYKRSYGKQTVIVAANLKRTGAELSMDSEGFEEIISNNVIIENCSDLTLGDGGFIVLCREI